MDNVSSQRFPDLVPYLRSRRDWYVDLSSTADVESTDPNVPPPDRAAIAQMVDGFLSVLVEALEGRTRETRTFLLETVFPGLIAQHVSPDQLIDGCTVWGVRFTVDIAEHYDGPDRAATIQWFARFFGGYVADVARVTHAVAARGAH